VSGRPIRPTGRVCSRPRLPHIFRKKAPEVNNRRYDLATWERIRDKTGPRIRKLVKKIARNISGDKSIARFQNLPRQFYVILEHRANEWLSEVYKICCEARNATKETETPDFKRAVWAFEIEPFIDEELPELLLLAAGFAMDTRGFIQPITPHRDPMVGPWVTGCDQVREKVRAQWMQKLVAEPGESEGQDTTRPAQKIPKAASVQKRKRNRPIDPRHTEIAVIKARTPGISHLEVCREMDRKLERNPAMGPRDTWVTKSNERTWVGNYNHKKTTSAVRAYVSRS